MVMSVLYYKNVRSKEEVNGFNFFQPFVLLFAPKVILIDQNKLLRYFRLKKCESQLLFKASVNINYWFIEEKKR